MLRRVGRPIRRTCKPAPPGLLDGLVRVGIFLGRFFRGGCGLGSWRLPVRRAAATFDDGGLSAAAVETGPDRTALKARMNNRPPSSRAPKIITVGGIFFMAVELAARKDIWDWLCLL